MKRDTNEIGRTMQLDCLVLIKLLYAIDPIKQKTTTKKRCCEYESKPSRCSILVSVGTLNEACYNYTIGRYFFKLSILLLVEQDRARSAHTHAQFLIQARIRLEHETSTGFGMRPCRAAWLPLLESRGEGVRSQLDQRFRTVAVDIVLFFREKLTKEKRRQADKSL